MATTLWYLRGMPLALRLVWVSFAGTDAQFEQVASDIDAYRETRPG